MLALILAAAGLFLLTSQKRPAAKAEASTAPPAPSNPARPTGISPGNAIAPPPPNESGQLQATKLDSATPPEAVIVTPDRPRGVGLASMPKLDQVPGRAFTPDAVYTIGTESPAPELPPPTLSVVKPSPAVAREQGRSVTSYLAQPAVYQAVLKQLDNSSAEFLKAWYLAAVEDLQAGFVVTSPPELLAAKRLGTIEGQRWLVSVKSGDTSVSAEDFLEGKTVASPDPVASNKLYYAAQRGLSELA